MNLEQLVRENIQKLKPFSSARAEFDGTADIFLDANENPFESSFNRYPDPYQRKLKGAISEWKKVPVRQIFLGNGSDEIIDLIVRTFCTPGKDKIRFINPSFGMYEVVADINDVEKQAIPLLDGFKLNKIACIADQLPIDKVLFLCSPNNPTGNCFPKEELIEVIEGFKGIVVLDEAYIDFSQEESLIHSLSKYDNLIVLQTFSKAIGAAGLRIGMAFTSEKIISYLNKIKPPYNLGNETQKNALRILQNIEIAEKELKIIISERNRLYKELAKNPSILYLFPSDANFILMKFDDPKDAMKYLISKDIIVRDRSTLSGCEGCLRITVGRPEENNQLLTALNEYTNK